jgi:hypothetical protein
VEPVAWQHLAKPGSRNRRDWTAEVAEETAPETGGTTQTLWQQAVAAVVVALTTAGAAVEGSRPYDYFLRSMLLTPLAIPTMTETASNAKPT